MESLATLKNINFKQKQTKPKNNAYVFKIESLTHKGESNKTIINGKNKNLINTYKTFSEISTKQNDTQKLDTSIDATVVNMNNNLSNTYSNKTNNNYLIIEEASYPYKENKINNKNIYHKEKGIFNGDKLFFDENGLKYGLRGKKDGYGFFGTDTHYHGKIINDYVLNINYGIAKKSSNFSYQSNSINGDKNNNVPIVYFVIYYDKEIKKFFLKNVRKINYNNLESYIFSFGIYKRFISNTLKIKENIIICFDENQNYALSLQPMNNNVLRAYLIKLDGIDNGINRYNKSTIIYKSNIENNGVSKIIGNKGNFKIDLQGKNFVLSFNKIEKCWEIKRNSKKNEIFWIMVDKKAELVKENVFKINFQFFKIEYY